jgi:hypothetical protein
MPTGTRPYQSQHLVPGTAWQHTQPNQSEDRKVSKPAPSIRYCMATQVAPKHAECGNKPDQDRFVKWLVPKTLSYTGAEFILHITIHAVNIDTLLNSVYTCSLYSKACFHVVGDPFDSKFETNMLGTDGTNRI